MGAGTEDTGAFAAIVPDAPVLEGERLKALIADLEAIVAAVPGAMAEADGPGDVTRIDLAHQVRDLVVTAAAAEIYWRDGYAAAEARCPVPIPGRHRSDRKKRPNPGQLRLLGVAALGAAAKPFRVVLHHGPVAKALAIPGAKVAAIATAGTVGVAVVTATVVTLAPAHAGAPAFGTAGAPAPAASVEGAVPISLPSARLIARVNRPKERVLSKDPVLSGTGLLLPPAGSPAASPSSSPSVSVSWSPSFPPPGALTGDTSPITVSDPTQAAQITVSASGSDVQWQAWVTGAGSPDVTLSPSSGDLAAGASVTIGVTFDSAAQQTGGSVVVHIGGGGGYPMRVRVNWQPAPAPAPTDAVVTTPPTDAPTPSPSGT